MKKYITSILWLLVLLFPVILFSQSIIRYKRDRTYTPSERYSIGKTWNNLTRREACDIYNIILKTGQIHTNAEIKKFVGKQELNRGCCLFWRKVGEINIGDTTIYSYLQLPEQKVPIIKVKKKTRLLHLSYIIYFPIPVTFDKIKDSIINKRAF